MQLQSRVLSAWYSASSGAVDGDTPGRVSRRASTASLSPSSLSVLTLFSWGESCTCCSFSGLSPTTRPSSKCFPSLLLKLLRHTTSFSEELYRSITYEWKHVMAPWFLYWKRQWAVNSQLHLSYSIHDFRDVSSPQLRSSLFQSEETHSVSPFLAQTMPHDSDRSCFPSSDLSLSYHTLLEQGDKNDTQYSGCSWTIATEL